MPDANRGRALRIAFAGTPAFAAASLRALLRGPHDVVAVLTQPDRPSGRGRKLTASAVKTLAVEHGVPVRQPRTLRDAVAVAELAACEPDVLVVVAYGLILPPEVLSLPRLGCLNVHASLLPRWRGAAPVQRAILAGDIETGVCIMQMDAGLDTGDVLARAATPIGADENASELTARLAGLGADLLGPALDARASGTLVPEPQPAEGITYAHKLDKSEARLDFSTEAAAVHRAVRAFHGWPVAEGRLEGERVRVWRSRLPGSDRPAEKSPGDLSADARGDARGDARVGTPGSLPEATSGEIVRVDADALAVVTGSGTIELLELQRPGGRALDAGTFARDRALVGRRFEPLAHASADGER